jgi:hypothetical protein
MAVIGYRLVLEDGPDLSDPRDQGNKPDELEHMHTPGCSQGDTQLEGLEPFILREASQGDHQALALVQEKAGGEGAVSGAQPNPAGVVSRGPPAEST